MDQVRDESNEGVDNGTERIAENPAKNDTRSSATIDKKGGERATQTGEQYPDPAAGIDPTRRKRTAPAKASGKSKSAGVDLTKEGRKTIALQLVGLHKMAGMVSGTGELLEITQDQSESLVNAFMDVMEQYKIKPNPKMVAWANLAGVVAMVYAPKGWIYSQVRKKQAAIKRERQNAPMQMAAEQPQNPPPDNVYRFN